MLHSRVIGQNEAVTAVAKAVRRARAGLSLRSISRFDLSLDLGCFMSIDLLLSRVYNDLI